MENTRGKLIRDCYNSRKGGDRAIAPQLCGSDWCRLCSRSKTEWLINQTNVWLNSADTYTFTTIILKPCRTYKEGLATFQDAMTRMNDLGIEGIGSFEIGIEKTSRAWVAFQQVFPFFPALHKGSPHIHMITRQKYDEDDLHLLFPIKNQCLQLQMGKGIYKTQSYEQNVARVVNYIRKRPSTYQWWVNDAGNEQSVFKMDGGCVFDCVDHSWVNHVDGGGSSVCGSVGNSANSINNVVVSVCTEDTRIIRTKQDQIRRECFEVIEKLKAQEKQIADDIRLGTQPAKVTATLLSKPARKAVRAYNRKQNNSRGYPVYQLPY